MRGIYTLYLLHFFFVYNYSNIMMMFTFEEHFGDLFPMQIAVDGIFGKISNNSQNLLRVLPNISARYKSLQFVLKKAG